jgi:hypothetical protein
MTNTQIIIEFIKIALTSFAFFSAIVAYKAYRANLRKIEEDRIRDRDKELLLQVQKSLQWAYDSLTDEGKTIPPKADRLNWLTCARHLLRARKLGEKISSNTYQIIYQETEEFWRHRFYLALDNPATLSPAYFGKRRSSFTGEQIEPRSAKTIIEFSAWKQETEDPIDFVELSLISSDTHGISLASKGFNQYLSELRQRQSSQGQDS